VETHALSEIHLEIKKGPTSPSRGRRLRQVDAALYSWASRFASDGSYTLNGQPVSKLSISERTRIRNREIGFIFQAFNLIGDLTVYENVELR